MQYSVSGLNNVYLRNGFRVIQDDEHGECVSFERSDRLHYAITKYLVNIPRRLTLEEIHYLRKEMNLSTPELAEHIGCPNINLCLLSMPEEALIRMLASEMCLRYRMSIPILMLSMTQGQAVKDMIFELVNGCWKVAL